MKNTLRSVKASYAYIVLRRMIITDLRLRYQNSILGYMWSLLRPLAMFAILYTVFEFVFNLSQRVPHYAAYLLSGIVVWNFFSEATMVSLSSIVMKGDLIRKVSFPRYSIILSAVASAGINLLLSLLIVFALMLINGVRITPLAALLPLLLIQLIAYSVAVSLILGALYVRFRDINFIWEVFLQASFYATPIIYPLGLVLQKNELVAKLIILNPIAQVVQDIRYVLITKETVTISSIYSSWYVRLAPIMFTALLLYFAVRLFFKKSIGFAEDV